MSRDPRTLESADLVREIHATRDEMNRLAARMVELSQVLYSRVRRAPADDFTSRYLAFANAWTRFGGMVDGGLRRTSGVTRLVESIQREKAEVESEGQKVKPVAPPASPAPDLVELYGQEMVNHAAR
jgi:hypothetical protein